MRPVVVALTASLALAGCQKSRDQQQQDPGATAVDPSHGSGGKPKPKIEQITPPFDVKTPPADAVKLPSGLVYKKIVTKDGTAPKRNDIVLINFTGWKQNTGETFFTSRSSGQPKPLNLATAAPGFAEAMQLLNRGEKMMLWLPPKLAYRGAVPADAEPLAFEVEITDISAAPAIPEDVAAPPASAKTLPSGTRYVTIRPGTGTEKVRLYDTATFNFTGWEHDGRMFDTTEMKRRSFSLPPYKQPPPMLEILTSMVAGERVRMWVDSEKMKDGKSFPGLPSGQLCYELEVLQIQKAVKDPPAAPPDVAKAPADATKTAKGVAYKVLKAGKGGAKPKPTDGVKINFTGWTSDGKVFESSVMKGEPAEYNLRGVPPGWADGIALMSAGDKYRFWIPQELASRGTSQAPGLMVYDLELVEIKAAAADAHGHGGHDDGGKKLPAPPDVKAPPKDALKSPKGVFYKVLKAGTGPKPKTTDRLKVDYTGWTTDGEMFDSSVTKGQPLEFSLRGGVIVGWLDAFPELAVGTKARLWIPEELAYKGKPGRPQGMLVFDVEVLEIK